VDEDLVVVDDAGLVDVVVGEHVYTTEETIGEEEGPEGGYFDLQPEREHRLPGQ
jgi:hypothetical protein